MSGIELMFSLFGGAAVAGVFWALGTWLDWRTETRYDRELRDLIRKETDDGA